jgi:hypothetical protein
LDEHGGEWEGEPNALREKLLERGGEAVPDRPDELSKMVLDIGNHRASLAVERAWRKLDGKSRRVLKLCLKDGVDRVAGVDLETASDNTDNTVYANFGEYKVVLPETDNTVYTDTEGEEGTLRGSITQHSPRRKQRFIECGHGYPRGKGCYLCDPHHPYRKKEGTV